MKKQIVSMFFVLLFNNVSQSMQGSIIPTYIYLWKRGDEPDISERKIHLPSQETIAQHLNTHKCGNLKNKNLYTTLGQNLSNKHTSERAIMMCTENTIKEDPIFKTLSDDAQFALVKTITNQIISLESSSIFSKSLSSSSKAPSTSSKKKHKRK